MRAFCFYLYLSAYLLLTPAFADTAATDSLFMLESDNEIGLAQAVRAYQEGRFQPVGKPVAGFGLNRHGAWLRIEAVNPTNRTLHRRLTRENLRYRQTISLSAPRRKAATGWLPAETN